MREPRRPVLKGRFVLSVFFSFSIQLSFFSLLLRCVFFSALRLYSISVFFPSSFSFFFDVTLGITEVIVALATPCGRPGHSAH